MDRQAANHEDVGGRPSRHCSQLSIRIRTPYLVRYSRGGPDCQPYGCRQDDKSQRHGAISMRLKLQKLRWGQEPSQTSQWVAPRISNIKAINRTCTIDNLSFHESKLVTDCGGGSHQVKHHDGYRRWWLLLLLLIPRHLRLHFEFHPSTSTSTSTSSFTSSNHSNQL